jgi:hypothetical protein
MTKNDWIEHDGGPMPCDGEVLVEVMYRDGKTFFDAARCFGWIDANPKSEFDIVKWKPVYEESPAPTGEPWHKHESGKMPSVSVSLVEVMRRDGRLESDYAVLLDWRIFETNEDIVKWRLKPQPQKACEPVASPEPILDIAKRITSGDRQASYGPPDQDFARTAAMWRALFGWDVDAPKVAMAMILLKLSRETHQRKRDNAIDIAGYAHCLDVCRQAQEPNQ